MTGPVDPQLGYWMKMAAEQEREMADLAHKLFLETIERCAQVADYGAKEMWAREDIAAAIRAMKDE